VHRSVRVSDQGSAEQAGRLGLFSARGHASSRLRPPSSGAPLPQLRLSSSGADPHSSAIGPTRVTFGAGIARGPLNQLEGQPEHDLYATGGPCTFQPAHRSSGGSARNSTGGLAVGNTLGRGGSLPGDTDILGVPEPLASAPPTSFASHASVMLSTVGRTSDGGRTLRTGTSRQLSRGLSNSGAGLTGVTEANSNASPNTTVQAWVDE
jgi:hypothetical protein